MQEDSLHIDPIVLTKPNRIKPPYSWMGHVPFAFFLVKHQKPSTIVELGTHTGNSYFAFCQAVKILKINTRCYAVDTWKGDEHVGYYDNSIYKDVLNYNETHYSTFSTLIRKTFDDSLHQFQDETIDLLHIDGLHTYEAVKHDFFTWLPKVKKQGIILLHDTEVHNGDFGVWKFWNEIAPNYPIFNFVHSNGLGVLCKGVKFPASLNFLNDQKQKDQLSILIYGAINRLNLPESKPSQDDDKTDVKMYFKKLDGSFTEMNTITLKAKKYISDIISFDIPADANATHYRLDPTERPVALSIKDICIEYKDKKQLASLNEIEIWTNADYSLNGFYFFLRKDPQIYINPIVTLTKKSKRVVVYLDFLIDEEVIKSLILNNQLEDNPFWINGKYNAHRQLKNEKIIIEYIEKIKSQGSDKL
jgi:hypothetical protein